MTGFFGSPNLGDEAICLSVLRAFRRHHARCVVATHSAARSRQSCGVNASWIEGDYPHPSFWLNFSRHLAAIWRADIVTIGGGGLFQDVQSWSVLPSFMLPAALGIMAGKRVATVAIGAGPLQRPWLSRLMAGMCRGMSLITVRDQGSADFLAERGVDRERIIVTGDPVCAMIASNTRRRRPARTRPIVGLSVRRWPGADQHRIAALIDRLVSSGYDVRILRLQPHPFDRFEQDLDTLVAPDVRQHLGVWTPRSVRDAIDRISRLDALIAMRLHANMIAVGLGVPTLAISYDPKVDSFMRRVGLARWSRPVTSLGEDLLPDLEACIRDETSHRARLASRFAEIVRDAETTFPLILDAPRARLDAMTRLRAAGVALLLIALGLASQVRRPVRKLRQIVARIRARFTPRVGVTKPKVVAWEGPAVAMLRTGDILADRRRLSAAAGGSRAAGRGSRPASRRTRES